MLYKHKYSTASNNDLTHTQKFCPSFWNFHNTAFSWYSSRKAKSVKLELSGQEYIREQGVHKHDIRLGMPVDIKMSV